MNEEIKQRIKQLALEAKLGSAATASGSRYYLAPPEAFERFAELIVKECSDIINHRAETSADYFDDAQANAHARQVQRDCAQTLRLSFGLETFGEEQ
jgi:cell division septum initiation protein DivIVA